MLVGIVCSVSASRSPSLTLHAALEHILTLRRRVMRFSGFLAIWSRRRLRFRRAGLGSLSGHNSKNARARAASANMFLDQRPAHPARIRLIPRIVPDIGIEVDLILVADGVGLQEPAERWRVEPRLVVVQPKLGDPGLAGVLESAAVARLRDAPGSGSGAGSVVVAVGRDAGAARVAHRNDAALIVGVQPARRGCARALVPDQRIVDARAVHVAPQQRARAIVFGDQRVAVMKEPRRPRRSGGFIKPAERVVAQPRSGRSARRHQPILDIVKEDAAPVRGEVAVRVIAEARAARTGILVEPVHRIGPADIVMRRPRVEVVRPRRARDLARRGETIREPLRPVVR